MKLIYNSKPISLEKVKTKFHRHTIGRILYQWRGEGNELEWEKTGFRSICLGASLIYSIKTIIYI